MAPTSSNTKDKSTLRRSALPTLTRHLFPSLYQINTRVSLRELSRSLGRPATLDDISNAELDRLATMGFDWVWFLGVWQTGAAGRKISRENPEWRDEFRNALSDLHEEDICGSCFAITQYVVAPELGGNSALLRLRDRVHERGMNLLLDFVPNHTALDHPWVDQHPEFYILGSEEQLNREPKNYVRVKTANGPLVLAYGRDPYFPGWPDSLQLNYSEPRLQEAMRQELSRIAEMCDGVRCDMAMLILPEVFERTWGLRSEPFWPNAIQTARSRNREFLFMAEVYWDLEWTLQQQGFDYTYDKRLYDRLRDGHARPVRDHFRADMNFQRKSVRFLENHDEPRAAATFTPEVHRAAAVLTFFCPGLRFFHDGEFEGRRQKLSVHLGRRPQESVDQSLLDFYSRLLSCMNRSETKEGAWELLECNAAWEANWTDDCYICFAWQGAEEKRLIVAVNFAPNRSQCYLRIPFESMRAHTVRFRDLMSRENYQRQGDEVFSKGLYLDLPAWGYNVFDVTID